MHVRYYLIMSLISISLMTNRAATCVLISYLYFLKEYLIKSIPHFKSGCFHVEL